MLIFESIDLNLVGAAYLMQGNAVSPTAHSTGGAASLARWPSGMARMAAAPAAHCSPEQGRSGAAPPLLHARLLALLALLHGAQLQAARGLGGCNPQSRDAGALGFLCRHAHGGADGPPGAAAAAPGAACLARESFRRERGPGAVVGRAGGAQLRLNCSL